jgi:hypothetical protein
MVVSLRLFAKQVQGYLPWFEFDSQIFRCNNKM